MGAAGVRRAAAIVGAWLVLATPLACGNDDDPAGVGGPTTTATSTTASAGPTSTASLPDPADGSWLLDAEPLENAAGVPDLLVSSLEGRAVRVVRGVATDLAGVPESSVPVLGDGSGLLVAERREPDAGGVDRGVALVRIEGGVAHEVPLADHDTVRLHDLVRLDGSTHVLYSLIADRESTDGESWGQLVLHDLSDDSTNELATAAGVELYLHHASAGRDVVALSYYADLTETVSFVDFGGAEVARPSPTDDLAYNAPPLVVGAVASPDGSEVAYLEGPDVDGAADPEALVGDWDVVVDDEGGEQLRLTVAGQAFTDVTLDFDGRWLVLSGRTADGPVEPLLIDSEAGDLAVYRVPGLRGTAVLESAAEGSGG